MNNEEALEWTPIVQRAARIVAREFPDSEVDDLEMAIWEGLLTYQAKGKFMSADEPNMETAMIFLGQSAGHKERKEHLTISVQYGYRTADIRKLLETFFDRNDWYGAEVPEDSYSELGSVALEMSTDLSRAWDKLSRPHKVLIFQAFGLRESTDSKKLSRAISRMADILNTWQPARRGGGPGTRKVISNATAAYKISNQDAGPDY